MNCGGLNQPHVLLYKKPVEQPLAALYLSQIPYTGFGGGPVAQAIFWSLLALWSAGVAYVVTVKGGGTSVLAILGVGAQAARGAFERLTAAEARIISERPAAKPASLSYIPVPKKPKQEKPKATSAVAAGEYGILSFDSGSNGIPRIRIAPAPGTVAPVIETKSVVTATTQPRMSMTLEVDPDALLAALAAGDESAAFAAIRSNPSVSIKRSLHALDWLLHDRIEGTHSAPPALAHLFDSWSNEKLENLIDALTCAVDRSYASPTTGAKLAITKALTVAQS